MYFRSCFTSWKLKSRISNGDLKSREIWIILSDLSLTGLNQLPCVYFVYGIYILWNKVFSLPCIKFYFCKHTCNFSNVMCSCIQFLMHTKTAIKLMFFCVRSTLETRNTCISLVDFGLNLSEVSLVMTHDILNFGMRENLWTHDVSQRMIKSTHLGNKFEDMDQ